ncbi:MAG: transcriptional regulator GutM [Rhodospirillales bacterium]|nr:transcriptional regulator GutM [Rhodospirillales bacterium]
MTNLFHGLGVPSWTGLIAVFAVVWLLQIAGTAWQMKHYQKVMGEIIGRWADGAIGVGNARSRLGKGLIVIIVVGPDDVVREVRMMEGRSIFARFRPLERAAGQRLADLAAVAPDGRTGNGFRLAVSRAAEQVARARARASLPAEPGLALPAAA